METIFPNGRQGRQGCGESPVLRETGRGDRETEPPFQGLPVPSCLLHWHTSTLDFPSCRPCLPFKKRGLGSKQKIQRVCGGALPAAFKPPASLARGFHSPVSATQP